MFFKDVEVGQKFEIKSDGQAIILEKVDEQWRESYCPTNAENDELEGVWVDENEEIEVVNG